MSDALLPVIKTYDALKPLPAVEEDSEEGRLLRRFNDIWSEAKQAKVETKKMMEQSYLSFRSILSEFTSNSRPVERWGLAVFVPITFQVVMSIQAQLNGRPPQYRVGPLNSPKDLKASRAVGDLSKAEFKRAKALREFADAVQLALIFGTAPLRSVYVNEVREVLVADGFEETKLDNGEVVSKKLKYKKERKTFYKGWKLVVDHPLTVYVPPVHKANVEDLPYYIVRDLADCRDERDYYENHPELCYGDNWKYIRAGGDATDDLSVYWKQDPIYNLDPRYPGSRSDLLAPHQTAVETQKISKEHIVEKFRVYDVAKDLWYIVMNDRIVEAHPNPLSSKRLPVVFVRDYKIVNSVWGLGEPQLIRYLQMEANALHTFALDGTKYATNGVFAVNDMYLKNPADMSVYPGKIFALKNLPNMTIDQVIQSFNMPDVKSSVFRMMGVNDGLVARTTGAGSAIIGGDPVNTDGSATESNNLKAAATTRIYERARAIEQENLVDVIEQQIEFMADFYDQELVAKISDEKFIKFVPGEEKDYPATEKAADIVDGGNEVILYSSDLEKGYDVVIEGESTLPVSKSERRTEGMQLLKIAADTRRPPTKEELAADPNLMQTYPQGIPIADPQKIFERIVLPTFTVVDNPEEYSFKLPEGTQDRPRGVGRPEDVLNPATLEAATTPPDPGLGGPQPADQGVNAMERMAAMIPNG